MVNLRLSEHFPVRILNAQTDGRDWTAKHPGILLWEKEHIDGKHGIFRWLLCVTASSYATVCYSFCKLRGTSSQNINFLWLMVWICSFFPCANHYWSILLYAGLLTTCKWSIHWVTAYKIISACFFRHCSLRFTSSPFFMVMHYLSHLPLLPLPDWVSVLNRKVVLHGNTLIMHPKFVCIQRGSFE